MTSLLSMDEPNWTDIAQTIVQILVLIGGACTYFSWKRSLKDRAASVLFELEERFCVDSLVEGRGLLEYQATYLELEQAMTTAMCETGASNRTTGKNPSQHTELTAPQEKQLDQLDALLRFYVLLRGIRAAEQVPDESLRLGYAYWINFYSHPKRVTF